MKKILTLLIVALFGLSSNFAQNNSTKKADKLFDRLEYVKAAEEYLKLAEKSSDNYVIGRLADAYYNIFNTKDAEKWYAKIVNDNPDAEIVFRYSEMLKANGKYKESNVWMSKFSEMKPYDTRAIAFRNTPNYLDKIIKKGKRFNVQNLKDVNKSEIIMLGILALLVIFFGFYPVPLMETLNVSVDNLINNYETAVQTNGLN